MFHIALWRYDPQVLPTLYGNPPIENGGITTPVDQPLKSITALPDLARTCDRQKRQRPRLGRAKFHGRNPRFQHRTGFRQAKLSPCGKQCRGLCNRVQICQRP